MIFPSNMKFQLGRLVITPAVLTSTVSVDDICRAINRHVCGDWGDVSDFARYTNDIALHFGGRLLSVYQIRNGLELRVLTTPDRLATTVHTPEDAVE